MLSIGNIRHSTQYLENHFFSLASEDTLICFVPFSHGFGSMTALLPTMMNTASIIILRSFHPQRVIDAIEELGGTHIFGVPSHYQQLLRQESFWPHLKKLKFSFCAAAPLKVETATEWEKNVGINLVEGYGCIETSTALSIRNSAIPEPMGEVGFHNPTFVEIQIKTDDGQFTQKPNVRGEIIVRAPSVMKGYLNLHDETAKTIKDNWYHTGDLGYFKENGSLVLAGRIKDVINIAGIKISPFEVETVLNTHPEVIESAVVGKDDDVYGEIVVAFVRKNLDSDLTERDVIKHSSNYLQMFQVPKYIFFLENLPRNNMGKVDKGELRKIVASRRKK
jgi:long-chain acyl-CoA synthetase